MNISTERLTHQHFPILQHWAGRSSGAMTPNDFPRVKEQIQPWIERNTNVEDRMNCLIFVYETPVGIAGLVRDNTSPKCAELHLLLCEVGYNLIRTATYATLCMLDRAFRDCDYQTVSVTIFTRNREYLDALERMGFRKQTEKADLMILEVDREAFFSRKYLF